MENDHCHHNKSCQCNEMFFYVPPTIVEGHYVFWSVGPFVCSSIPPSGLLQLIFFLVKVVFDEVEDQSTLNLVL